MKKLLTIISFILLFSSIKASDTLKAPINDGPYVSIVDDTTVLVQYVSADSLIEFKAYGKNRISFSGKGFDSLNNYNVETTHQIPDYKTDSVSKLFVFSDMHGEFENLCELLINNKIIDSNLNWSFGDGHLVIDGDMLDRGDKVTEILWMIYRLEHEAKQVGGGVHYVLGNHEMMPLQKDLRYIHQMYIEVTCPTLEKTYDELFDGNTILGDWLRSKNICEVINGILFVHGGISTTMMHNEYSLAYINETIRANIDTPRDSIKTDSTLTNLFGSFGPIWYRGFHYDMEKYKQLTMPEVDSLLDYYDVTNIIVGHTVKDSTAVLYDGKIFGINQDYEIRDEFEGLYIENGKFYACDINGVRRQIHSNK